MIELCDRLNATENIRGIHYNFAIQRPRWYAPGRVSIYVSPKKGRDRIFKPRLMQTISHRSLDPVHQSG